MWYFSTERVKKKTSVWKKFSLNNNVNAVVLGQIYRSMLSSFLRIGEQYLPPCFARRKILSLNSSEWWQHWLIHPPQNYRIPSISTKTLKMSWQILGKILENKRLPSKDDVIKWQLNHFWTDSANFWFCKMTF